MTKPPKPPTSPPIRRSCVARCDGSPGLASAACVTLGASEGGECTEPFTIDFDTPVPARCLRLELTEILELGGGIWWAITEFYVY